MRRWQKFCFVLCGVLTFCQVLFASPLAELPSVIPFENIRPEATDLVLNGRRLLPAEVAALRDQGHDVSAIDPDATTDLWNPAGLFPGAPVDGDLLLPDGAEGEFVATLESPLKTFRFVIQSQDGTGYPQLYQVFLGKRLQTYLLRRNLLRRLGYYVPPMKRLSRLDVRFSSLGQKENFVGDKREGLKWNALGDKEWILNLDDKGSYVLQMQDVVILPAVDQFANLSFGVIRGDINQGRRMINALLVPFNLVDVKESVNGFRWHSAQIKSNTIHLPLEDEEGFTTTMADAKWIMSSILNLTRQDWESIVAGIGYPEAAEKLLVEKLISRRNELRRLLSLPGQDLPYNPMISWGEDLREGELLRGSYPGVAGQLAMEELSSLISGAEMRALLKSKVISTAISELVRRVNTEIIPRTNIERIATEKQIDAFLDDLIDFIKTGEVKGRKLGIWSTPYYSGQLIASREVVAGSYLGTDNRVQLVDTLGVGVETGLYFGTTGLKPDQFADAQAKVLYVRTYSHIKPLTSIKNSFSEPYRNILVPALKSEWASLIDPSAFEKKENQDEEEWAQGLKAMVTALKDNLSSGESLIVSDNIGTAANIRLGYRFTDRVRAQAEFEGGLMALSRLHIQRVGDTLNVYKDFGNLKSLQFVISLRAEVEVLNVRAKFSKGSARTDFYTLDMNDDLEENPDLPLVLSGIRDLLTSNSVKRIQLFLEPHVLEHGLKESSKNFNFLVWNHFKLKSEDRLKLQRAYELDPEYYVRRLIGSRSGKDFQTLSVNLVNEILAEVTEEDVKVSNTTSGDEGETLFGKSKARYAYFEGELRPQVGYEEQFVGVIYRWKGWSAKRSELEKIVKEFSERFQFQFYHPESFSQIKAAELYTMNLRIFIYDQGVQSIVKTDLGTLEDLLDNYLSVSGHPDYIRRYKERVLRTFYFLQRNYAKNLKKKNFNKLGDLTVRMVSLVESSLNHEGLLKIVGGPSHILIQPLLTGFFKGEDGKMAEIPIEGSEIGQIGSDRPFGPMTSTQMDLGMTESEFFVYWLMRRI